MTPPDGGTGAVKTLVFTTAGTSDPFGAWKSVLDLLFECAAPRPTAPLSFDASLVVHHFGTFLLCRSKAAASRYQRSQVGLVGNELDHIVISCLLSGEIALADPAAKRLRPGDVAIIDLSAPFAFATTEMDALHLIMPRWALPASIADQQPASPRFLVGGSAMGIIVRGVLEALAVAAHHLATGETLALSGAIPELLAYCLASTVRPSHTGPRPSIGQRLRRHIEENLHRDDLTPIAIAREMGVSRSQLYRQFENVGGVRTYIRRRRLRRSLSALCDPRHADRRIGEIAYDAGFADEAHFSRLFRQRFGISPREARASVRAGRQPGLSPAAATEPSLSDWLLALISG
ncbi:helix-turn-helix domain-containing protein [Ciceribacter azotifigens]|uniref:helix-turn-helix domain-containing protein n=1 Tax=Ciceribacter azotifigens TaxID=2069303 RepID=UPI003A877FBB